MTQFETVVNWFLNGGMLALVLYIFRQLINGKLRPQYAVNEIAEIWKEAYLLERKRNEELLPIVEELHETGQLSAALLKEIKGKLDG